MNLKKENFHKNLLILLIAVSILPILYLQFRTDIIPNSIYRFANVFGYIGGVLMIWQFGLGIRRFSSLLTTDYDWLIKIHTFLGINSAIFVLLHPIFESYTYSKGFDLLLNSSFSNQGEIQILYGKIAFFLFLIVWFSSSLLRKLFNYRIWLYTHYLTYPMMFFVVIHPYFIGTFLNAVPFIKFYWVFLSIVLLLMCLTKLSDILNFNSSKFALVERNSYPGENFTFTFKSPEEIGKIIPGQYFYIKKDFLGEAHPFSVLKYNESSNEIEFGVKVLGKFTQDLTSLKVGDQVFIDGPYGQFTIEGQNSDPKVMIAGGIGITPFYELVEKYGNDNTYLFYSNMKLDFALLRDDFKKRLGNRYFDCLDGETASGENVICSRIDSEVLKNNLSQDIIKGANFFICGGPGFMNAIKSSLISLGVSENKIFIEEFGY